MVYFTIKSLTLEGQQQQRYRVRNNLLHGCLDDHKKQTCCDILCVCVRQQNVCRLFSTLIDV
jgi:hypothetical protein